MAHAHGVRKQAWLSHAEDAILRIERLLCLRAAYQDQLHAERAAERLMRAVDVLLGGLPAARMEKIRLLRVTLRGFGAHPLRRM